MISHENYEKRSLNMDYNYAFYSIIRHLTNDKCMYVCHANLLYLIKDHLPDGTPC